MKYSPSVSVGIPTYNRPDGLLSTIKNIAAQTYKNIEIIISDNASDNYMVKRVADAASALDSRIKVYHQERNIGIVENFKFVLSRSASDFFMWAADDDEWAPDFIEKCLAVHRISNVGTVMPGFYRFIRSENIKAIANLPRLEAVNIYEDVVEFLNAMPHSIFYGLHKRNSISWILDSSDDFFDDEFFIIKQIFTSGVKTFPEMVLYGAGMSAGGYSIKLPKEASDRYFYQYKRLIKFVELIAVSEKINDLQKIEIMRRILIMKLKFVINFESSLRSPDQLKLVEGLHGYLNDINVFDLLNPGKMGGLK